MQIRPSFATDFEAILEIINDAAQAYRGVILYILADHEH